MAIDPDVQPLLDALTADIAAAHQAVDSLATRHDAKLADVLRLLAAVGDQYNALFAADKSFQNQLAHVMDRLAALEASPPDPEPPTTARYAGDPGPGKIRLGVTFGSNTDPAQRHETSGKPVGCRRTFVSRWSDRDKMLGYARTDLAKGRYPMLSTKVDVKAMASGSATVLRELDELAVDLAALPGPVAFGMYHEPEDNIRDGQFTYAQWRRVQQVGRDALDKAGAVNVCHAIYPMSWSWNPKSGRNPDELYPGDGVWDALGVDAYQKGTSGVPTTEMDEWKRMKAWADERGLPIIVGEWGEKGTDAYALGRLRKSYEGFLRDGVGAVAWFDTALSGGQDYVLEGARLGVFHELLVDERSVTL